MTVDLDGLTIAVEPSGTPRWKLIDLEGWFSPPPTRTRATDIPYMDGGFDPGRTFRSAKRMALVGMVYGTSAADAEELAWERIAALSPAGLPMTMTVTTPRGVRTMQVWLDSGQPLVAPYTATSARFRIPLYAPDPRRYAEAETGVAGPAGSAGDGLAFPLFAGGYLDFGTFSPSGLFYIENTGTAASWPTFLVRGLLTDGFSISSGDLSIEYQATVPLGTEVFLSPYIGGRARIDETDVTASLVVDGWPQIAPGENRLFVFSPLGAVDSNAQLTWSFKKAWW